MGRAARGRSPDERTRLTRLDIEHHPLVPIALVGFALLGTGVAIVIPLVFAAAGRVDPSPARSIAGVAGVAGVAYGSGLIAPGVIGAIASMSSLKTSFGLVCGLLAIMATAAGVLRRGQEHPATRPPRRNETAGVAGENNRVLQ